MQFVPSHKWRISLATSLVAVLAMSLAGCGNRADTSLLGTFRMGEKVQIGPLTYTVLESEWKNSLNDAPGSRPPQNRYLLVRLSCVNTGNAPLTIPTIELVAADKKTYTELTQGVADVPNWLGVIRTVQPGKTEQGRIVFDA